jgi:superfamily II DNA or RNA helicase
MILARPTRSLIRFIQMVGRVLRPAPGKTKALLLDHSGSTSRLGHPCDDLPLELDDGKPKVGKNKQVKEREQLPKACPFCKFMRPAGVHVCPACGRAPERQADISVADGELVKQERKKPISRDVGQHIYSQFVAYGINHGYKSGWAFHKYSEFTGKKATGLRQIPCAITPQILGWIKSRQIAEAKARSKKEGGK